MKIEDKIGRELAKGMAEKLGITELNHQKMIENTKLYHFFMGRDMWGFRVSSEKRDTIIIPFELTALLESEIINQEQHDDLLNMLYSDEESKELCKAMVNELRNKRLRKK